MSGSVDDSEPLQNGSIDPPHLTDEEEQALVEAEPTVSAVTYSGQDFDVAGLVRRLSNDDIKIPTFGHEDEQISTAGFQRSFVWTRKQMDRFIESLLLGFPIPGIFLVRQGDRRYLVLDGQQRLRTLKFFYDGIHNGKEFELRNVANRFIGLTYKALSEEQRRLLDDTFLQATIVSTDNSSESLEAIYQIFERLNSGGTPLTPHEIRVALFAGPLIDFVESLNRNDDWRSLYGPRSPRLRDQELVLRIIALYSDANSYRRPLKTFLNSFVARERQLAGLDVATLTAHFRSATTLILQAYGRQALRYQSSQVNAALTEAIVVGLLRRLNAKPHQPTSKDVSAAIHRIHNDPTLLGAIGRATADEESVRSRLDIAIKGFAVT